MADAGPVELSAVTYMELAQGVRNKDVLALLRRAVRLGGWQVIPLTEPISLRAVGLVEAYALPHGMRLADALVAATALERDQALATATRDTTGSCQELDYSGTATRELAATGGRWSATASGSDLSEVTERDFKAPFVPRTMKAMQAGLHGTLDAATPSDEMDPSTSVRLCTAAR